MKSSGLKTRRSLRQWIHENRHVYWALGVILILLLYFIPEQIVVDTYWPTQIPLDDKIPYVPEFVLFYLMWFPCLIGVGLWLLLRDGDGFRKYMWYLMAAYAAAAVIYLIFPNGQDLRPEVTQPRGICEKLLLVLYSADTNTNVLPSLHVVGAIGFTAAVFDTKTIQRGWIKALICVLAVLISASTLFVKQHAVLDAAAGAVMGAALYLVVYRWIGRKMKASKTAI